MSSDVKGRTYMEFTSCFFGSVDIFVLCWTEWPSGDGNGEEGIIKGQQVLEVSTERGFGSA